MRHLSARTGCLFAPASFLLSTRQGFSSIKLFVFLIVIIIVGCSDTVSAQWALNGTTEYYNGGFVGIGTNAPTTNFQVSGGHIAASNADMSGFVQLWADNSIIWKHGNASNGLRFGSATNLGAGSYTEVMRIMDGGNLGIGTMAPAYKLELFTATTLDGFKIGFNNTGFVRLHPNSLSTGAFNPITQNGDAGIVYGATAIDNGSFGFIIGPWSSTMHGMRLDQYGNVGINTNNTQGYQLAVNGSAIFTSAFVKAYTTWPDYVFKKDYNLLPLDSLASFIESHHHLPGVACADSVERKGIDLGGTEVALLKKIEELTLYVLDQKKELDALKEQNRKQQESLNRLDDLISHKTSN